MATTEGITGRDGFILCKALAYAIVAIDERLPEDPQEWIDKADMHALFKAHCRNDERGVEMFLTMACGALGRCGVTVIDGQHRWAKCRSSPGQVVEFPDNKR